VRRAERLSVFDLIRYRRQDDVVTLCAFDLLELDGVDLRREPIEVRKRTLEGLMRRERRGIAFNRHFDMEGAIVYRNACAHTLTLSRAHLYPLTRGWSAARPAGAAC
jgi:ATP-dependent DNA ligase